MMNIHYKHECARHVPPCAHNFGFQRRNMIFVSRYVEEIEIAKVSLLTCRCYFVDFSHEKSFWACLFFLRETLPKSQEAKLSNFLKAPFMRRQ